MNSVRNIFTLQWRWLCVVKSIVRLSYTIIKKWVHKSCQFIRKCFGKRRNELNYWASSAAGFYQQHRCSRWSSSFTSTFGCVLSICVWCRWGEDDENMKFMGGFQMRFFTYSLSLILNIFFSLLPYKISIH